MSTSRSARRVAPSAPHSPPAAPPRGGPSDDLQSERRRGDRLGHQALAVGLAVVAKQAYVSALVGVEQGDYLSQPVTVGVAQHCLDHRPLVAAAVEDGSIADSERVVARVDLDLLDGAVAVQVGLDDLARHQFAVGESRRWGLGAPAGA